MAVINCDECKGNVSTLAAACPHCGAPVPPAAAATSADSFKIPWPPILPPQNEAKPGPSSPQPMLPARPPNLDGIFRLKILGLMLILSGIGCIGYLFVASQVDSKMPRFSPGPISLLFAAGYWAFSAARSRQDAVERQLQKKSQ